MKNRLLVRATASFAVAALGGCADIIGVKDYDASSASSEPEGPQDAGSAGTSYLSIPATTCIPHGPVPANLGSCFHSNTVRTDGDTMFPCAVAAGVQRNTYVCPLYLPHGAIITEILAYVEDNSASGYAEAAVWRSFPDAEPDYISGFGGTWASSGIAFTSPSLTNFPIFSPNHLPHTVDTRANYVIGFALRSDGPANQSVWVFGFRVQYTLS